MDSRDLKRLSSKAKEQSTHIEGAFQQLAQDVAVRQKVNDASMSEIKEQLESINKITQENGEAFKRYDQMTETNARDIETLKDQIGILKNCIVDLQKRNQFLEDLNASLINQLKKLVEGLSTSAIQEQNVMKGVIGEILSRVCNKPGGTKGKRVGVTTQTGPTDKKTNKSNIEGSSKSNISKKHSVETNREDEKDQNIKIDTGNVTKEINNEDSTDNSLNKKLGDTCTKYLGVTAEELSLSNTSKELKDLEPEKKDDAEDNWTEADKVLKKLLNKEELEIINEMDEGLENGDEILTYEEIMKNLSDDIASNSVTEFTNGHKNFSESCDLESLVKDTKTRDGDSSRGDQKIEDVTTEVTKEVFPKVNCEKTSNSASNIEENSKVVIDRQPHCSEVGANSPSSNKINEMKKKKQRKRKKSEDSKSENSSNSVLLENKQQTNEEKKEEVTSVSQNSISVNNLQCDAKSKDEIQTASKCSKPAPKCSKVTKHLKCEASSKDTENNRQAKDTVVKCKEVTEKDSTSPKKRKNNLKTDEKEHKHSDKNGLIEKKNIVEEKEKLDLMVEKKHTDESNINVNTKTDIDINQIDLKLRYQSDEKNGQNLEDKPIGPKLQCDGTEQTNHSELLVTSEAKTLSATAKEFEPMREYGKAKLHLKTEIERNSSTPSSCPKLFNVGMADKLGTQDRAGPEGEQKGNSESVCVQCGSEATQRCANCRQVFYCNRDCQKENWKAGHKNKCKPFKMEKHFIIGRHLVATRDFKAGDVIFKEEPLLIGPKQITEPICLGCYKRVDGSYRCRKCTWPLCGPACEKSLDHQPECVVGKEMGSPVDIQDFSEPNHFYEVVTTLRGLALKKKSPKKYSQLLDLVSHFEDRKGTEVYNTNQKRVVNMLRNYFMIVDFPPDEIDASEGSIHQMTGIIDGNSIDIPLKESEIVGIYPTYSLLEHSCTPNIKYKISRSKQITVKAAVNIRQGEPLSTIYTHMLWGTAARREHLMSTRYFMCTCRRCADPTELGTNFSALRCKNCPTGFLISSTPLDETAIWVCPSCDIMVSPEEVKEVILQLGEEVEKALANPNVKTLESLIERSSSTIVHPNHFHLFAVKHSLLQMLGRDSAGLDGELMLKKEKLCQEFLKTCTALDPGMCKLSSYAGVALYEYHLAVLARARHGPTDQQVDKEALKKDLETAKALLQQCIKVLQDESNDKAETQLRTVAQENLIELNQWAAPLFE